MSKDECQNEENGLQAYQVNPNDTVIIDHDYELSEEELMELAGKIAELDAKEDEIDLERKMIAAQWASKLKDTQTMRKKFSKMFRTGKETRSVECIARPDYKTGTMDFFDIDTNKLILSRQLLPEERQLKIEDFNRQGEELIKEMFDDPEYNKKSEPEDMVWICDDCGGRIPFRKPILPQENPASEMNESRKCPECNMPMYFDYEPA